MKLLFCGTPAFAVPSLEKLWKSGHTIVGVVTQPDRPRGRGAPAPRHFLGSKDGTASVSSGRTPQPPPVKELALSKSLPVFQPDRPSDPAFIAEIKKLGAECAAVVAYGRLLPKEFLALFRHGAVNLHASLLPKYRGAAPIQWAVLRGETETGVTVFELDEQLDHGPILLQQSTPIKPEEDAVALAARLAEIGGMTLIETLDLLETGMKSSVPQDDTQATHAPLLTKEDGIIRWELPAVELRNRIRGLQPWPGADTVAGNKSLKILSATAAEEKPFMLSLSKHERSNPGLILSADPAQGLWVQTGKGRLRIDRLQPSGGNPMPAADFLRGHSLKTGDHLK